MWRILIHVTHLFWIFYSDLYQVPTGTGRVKERTRETKMKQRVKIITTGIRMSLTIILLFIVWFNVHWSVALMLTLQFVAIEVTNWIVT